MNRVALVASASLLFMLTGLTGLAQADETAQACAALDTCDGVSIGGSCTTLAYDAGAATSGFCAPSSECDGSAILCLPPLGTGDGGDAGTCVSDPSCVAKDASDSCGDGGACVLSTCSNGNSILMCGVATSTYGCDNKQENEPCTTGPGTAGFCLPIDIDDGSVQDLECDTDVATEGPDCRVAISKRTNAGLSTAATIGAGLVIGLGLIKRRKKQR